MVSFDGALGGGRSFCLKKTEERVAESDFKP